MTRTLTTRQSDLSGRRALAPITLVVITTYSDRTAKTVSNTYYYSTEAVAYDFENTGTVRFFQPFLVEPGTLAKRFPHLSTPAVGGALLEFDLTLEFQNALDPDGSFLFETLKADQIVMADIEVAELLLVPVVETAQDAESISGVEHFTLYRGSVNRLRDADETFSMDCIKEAPQTSQVMIRDINVVADLDDVGKRANQVYGDVKRIPCHGVLVGSVTTLRQPIADDDTSLPCSDVGRFQDSGIGKMGLESFTWSGRNTGTNRLTPVVRGTGGTTAVARAAGALVTEVPSSIKYAVAAHEMNSVSAVYAMNPLDGRIMLIPSGRYQVSLVDDGDELESPAWTSIKFTNAQVETLIDNFEGQVEYGADPPASYDEFVAFDTETIVIRGLNTNAPTEHAPATGTSPNEWDDVDVTTVTGGHEHKDVATTPQDGVVHSYASVGAPALTEIDTWFVRVTIDWAIGSGDGEVWVSFWEMPTNSGWGGTSGDLVMSPGVGSFTSGEITYESATYTTTAVVLATAFELTSSSPTWTGPRFLVNLRTDKSVDDDKVTILNANIGIVFSGTVPGGTPDPRTVDINSATRFQGGAGLKIFADGVGYKVPAASTDYSVAAAEPLLIAPDIIRHLLTFRTGSAQTVIDETSWGLAETEISFSPLLNMTEQFETTDGATGPTNHPEGHATQQRDTVFAAGTGGRRLEFQASTPNGGAFILSTAEDLVIPKVPVNRWRYVLNFAYQAQTSGGTSLVHGKRRDTATLGASETGSQIIISVPNSTALATYQYISDWFTAPVGTTMQDFALTDDVTWAGPRIQVWIVDGGSDEFLEVIDSTPSYWEIENPNNRGFVETDLGENLTDVLSRFAFESRSQIVRGDGNTDDRYRYLVATNDDDGTFSYTASGTQFTHWRRAVETTRNAQNIYTRWLFLYDADRGKEFQGRDPLDIFAGTLQADPDFSDLPNITTTTLTNAEKVTSRFDHEAIAFLTIQGMNAAVETAEFYISESIRAAAAIVDLTGVPWSQAYDLELGDVRNLQLDAWSSVKKMRVLGYVKNIATSLVDVLCIEVD